MNLNKTIFTGAIALFITVSGSFAQVKKKASPSPKSKQAALVNQIKPATLPVDPDIITGKLPNGLTYYIRSNSKPKNRAVLYLVDKAGSVLETDAQQGIAHFTEHMAFDGTRDFPKDALINYLQKSGVKFGADVNASTSFDETVFNLTLPTDSAKVFEQGINILANWAGYVTFDPVEMDKERGVILEESRIRGKNAQERLQQQTWPSLLNNSRYALRLPIGKEDIIKSVSPATIKSFYHDWYRPDLQAVIIVGDFDPKRVEQLIKDNFSQLKNPSGEKPRLQYSVSATPGTVVKFVTDKELPYTVAQIVVKLPKTTVKTEADYLQSMRISLFNQMLNARISELKQMSNPPFLFGQAAYGPFVGRQDAFTSVIAAQSGGLEIALKAIVAQTERARIFGFTTTELERVKQNALVQIGNAFKEKGKTNSGGMVGEYIRNFIDGEGIPGIDYEYNFYVNNISKISLNEINALAGKFISDQNRSIIIEAPEADKDKIPDEKTLLGWIAEAGKNLTPYVDNVNTEPLLAKIPPGSKVVKQQADNAISTTTLTLENGVRVILKPTQFENDQVLISGYGFGGTSLASDQDFTSADLAASVIPRSGAGDFNQIQLTKLLSGKRVNLTPYISEITQGISGSSSVADFETAMQLLYLYFTQPRKDAEIWNANNNQIKALLANRAADPLNVYRDTAAAILSNHNFRDMTITDDRLNAASLDKGYDFYKDRFADASGFTFTFAGNFTVAQIAPYLETYLGALPSSHHNETYKDLGIHPPSGQITKTIYKGIGNKSIVQLVFSGSYDYNEINNLQLDALEGILDIKLIERLRDKESGVYTPSINTTYVKFPEGRYKFIVSFGCDPVNVDKLINATVDEIGKIKQNGAELIDIQKYTAQESRSTQVQLGENVFWAGYLSSASQNQEDPDQILQHIQNLSQVTIQSTKDAANKYLRGDNLIKLILLPEKK
jgi:zinc protease